MTFPCKENLITFEQLARRQRQIYPDAADFGIPLAELSAAQIEGARRDLREMLEVFGKPEYDYQALSWGTERTGGKSVDFFIPIEIDEGKEAGLRVHVSTHRDRRVGGNGFMQIAIRHGYREIRRA